MKIILSKKAEDDLEYWKQNDAKKFAKIKLLISDIISHPYSGLGKPEALRFELAGKWSRRIDHEHRLLYEIKDERIIIHQCRFHY